MTNHTDTTVESSSILLMDQTFMKHVQHSIYIMK
jgi:hypothetical protein